MALRQSPSPEAPSAAASLATVSVVIPAWSYDRRGELADCIAAIEAQSTPPLETIVVSDHNPELTAWARQALPGVKVLENRYEQGIVGGRNTGIEQASGEILVFTDDDTRADPGWIENVVATFADPEVVGVAGRLVPNWTGPEPRWFPTEFYWVFGCSYTGLPTTVAPVRNAIGANMSVRREAIEAVGGFRIGVPPRVLRRRGRVVSAGHALEDTDLGIRIGRAYPDKHWLFQPAATVHHTVDPGRATFDYLLVRSYEEGEGKAVLAATMGASEGLESERRHLLVMLPKGFGRGFIDLLKGDVWGPVRSFALLAGVGAAAVGFAAASLRARLRPPPKPES